MSIIRLLSHHSGSIELSVFITVKNIMIEKTDNDDVNDFQPLVDESK